MIRRPPISTLFPYPTLSRSLHVDPDLGQRVVEEVVSPAVELRGRYDLVARAHDVEDRERLRGLARGGGQGTHPDRKSTRLNSSHANISYAVFCLKKNNNLRN